MSNSYTQNYLHCIFSTKNRDKILNEKYDEELHKYISGLAKERKCNTLSINNVSDHVHLLVALHSTYSISKFMQEIKAVSSKFINDKGWYKTKFSWQYGYGAFSCSQSQVIRVKEYIKNQKSHNKKITFKEEYIEFPEKYEIKYKEENI
ncbi:MAG: IS200/IS605 family transposase [Candidatus Delongbacteria bacterium]|nr:IS200/IS605 family transposase [Candidatus Delongbacteria bacterium]